MIIMDPGSIQEALCRSLCASVVVKPAARGRLHVSTPFLFPDGDPYELFIEPLELGGVRVTDLGLSIMHLSYTMDVDLLNEGNRRRVLDASLAASGAAMGPNGHVYVEGPASELGSLTFRLGQAITSILSASFIGRVRNESSFYDDLRAALEELIPGKVTPDYLVPELGERAVDYPVDYKIDAPRAPLFLFGVPTREKARLVTITLRAIDATSTRYDSMIVFQRQEDIPPRDLARLSDIGGDMISSLSARPELQRKLEKKLAA